MKSVSSFSSIDVPKHLLLLGDIKQRCAHIVLGVKKTPGLSQFSGRHRCYGERDNRGRG